MTLGKEEHCEGKHVLGMWGFFVFLNYVPLDDMEDGSG